METPHGATPLWSPPVETPHGDPPSLPCPLQVISVLPPAQWLRLEDPMPPELLGLGVPTNAWQV